MKDLSKLYFPGRQPDETVMMAIRRHPIVIGKRFTAFVLSLLIPFLMSFVIHRYTTLLDTSDSLLNAIAALATSMYYLIACMAMYHSWVNYYLDLWVVTNERVVSINQVGIFNRKVSELQLDRIQDVSSEVKGFIASIFKYGKVELQTAGREEHFEFTQVPDAEKVASEILEMHEQYIATRHQELTQQVGTPEHTTGGV